MNIHELRQETYRDFETLNFCQGTFWGAPLSFQVPKEERDRLCFTNKTFKDTIRQEFGDLRRKETWRKAAIHYCALCAMKSTLEPYQLVCFIALPEEISNPVRNEFGAEVIEKMLSYPDVLERVRAGLEQLFRELPDVARDFVRAYEGAIAFSSN